MTNAADRESDMTPYYETELGKLYHGDCLEIMPHLEPVDLVFTSPPYNLGEPKKGSMFGKQEGKLLQYESHNDSMEYGEYVKWQHAVLQGCYSILTNSGAIFYNHKPRIQDGVYQDRRNLIPFPLRQEIIWDRASGFNFSGSFFVPSTEKIFIVAKNGWKPNKEHVKFGEIWRIPVSPGRHERADHPAPFPKALAQRVIMSASKKNMVVLDPFFGSGTVALAAEELSRRWTGIEIEEKYCEIAAKRIENERKQLKLF